MKKETKEDLQIYTAVGVVLSGIVMCFIGFFSEPKGQVHDTVLWFLGQCFMFGGCLFGITQYTRQRFDELETKFKKKEG